MNLRVARARDRTADEADAAQALAEVPFMSDMNVVSVCLSCCINSNVSWFNLHVVSRTGAESGGGGTRREA